MNAPPSSAAVEAAMNFLRNVNAEDAASLGAAIDYPAVVALAASRGFETDTEAVGRAFRILMRMRNASRPVVTRA